MKYPTDHQKNELQQYITKSEKFSIYGMDGIYKVLENKFCKIHDSKFAILTNTGTSSLSSAYFGLNLKRGDEVICPIFTFIATVTPLLRLGCIPVFADCDGHGRIETSNLKKLLTKNTKALVITHMWGVPNDMETIVNFCKENNLKLVEDASHAHLTKHKGKYLGTFGDVGCFSLGAKKIISGGEGGLLITDDEEIYMRATLLGHFNMRAEESLEKVSKKCKDKYLEYLSGFGENYRMHPYSAVMINALLDEINEIIENRYKVFSYFAERIEKLKNISIHPIVKGAMYGFKPKIISKDLDTVIRKVKEQGLKIKYLDTIPLLKDKIFENCKFPLAYVGAKEYMVGRVSIPDFCTNNLQEDVKIVDQYIEIFKKVL